LSNFVHVGHVLVIKTLVPKFADFAAGRFKRAVEIEPPGFELTAGGDGVS